ncbi:hypothetical protein GHT07_16450 [Caenimonas koreensis DSM 17982]|uniref:Uncharacterized protein n=1 Tax=Caenimonas koreensis DSM 17982 TaxID=1121255 RepID=A0A844BBC3_9BURK|nr:hypothetical protein [Caenimonas koreensis]MRD48879.1 hypothetical protein [Caenimonas koreensis DSM 17982]
MTWDRCKRTFYGSLGVIVAAQSRSSASSARRNELDLGRVQPACRPNGDRSIGRRVLRAFRRQRNGPVPGAQPLAPAPDASVLAGARIVSAEQAKLRLMQAELARALPMLHARADADCQARADAIAGRLVALEQLCVAAGEPGLFIERILSELRNRWADVPLSQALAQVDAFVLELATCLGKNPPGEKPAREEIARAAIILAMPGLHSIDEDGPPHDRLTRLKNNQMLIDVAQQLAALDVVFAFEDKPAKDGKRIPRPGYAFDRLFSALCNHARILELGRDEGSVEHALSGLEVMIGTLSDSIGPNRDGYELNALIGIDTSLDMTIASLRIDRVTAVMVAHPHPSDGTVSAADAAKDLVERECELARARNRLMRAFDRAGVKRPAEVLRGLKMDPALVAGLARQLGKKAKQVGLAIMGVYLREQDIGACESGKRMLRCIEAAKAASSKRIEQGNLSSTQVWSQRNFLRAIEPRANALRPCDDLPEELVASLDMIGISPNHVLQLEKQGLSSAAEAYATLEVLQKSLDGWVADGGMRHMESQGLLDMLRTRRQEERAVTLGETMFANLLQPDGLLPSQKSTRVRRDLARAAVLHLIPDAMKPPPGLVGSPLPLFARFRPDAAAVQAVLAEWGVAEDLTKEIELAVQDDVTHTTLALWADEAGVLPEDKAAPPKRVDFEGDRAARSALVDSLADVKIGSRVKMTAVKRVKLSAGLLGDTVGVNVRASAARMRGVDFGNPGDPGGSWEIVLRSGGDFKIGADATLPLLALPSAVGVKVGPTASADVSAQAFNGVVLRCKTQQAYQRVAKAIVLNPSIDFAALEDVDSIMFLHDVQGAAELGAGVQAIVKPGSGELDWGSAASSRALLGARAGGNIGVQHTRTIYENNKGHIQRDETVAFGRLAATASIGMAVKVEGQDMPGLVVPAVELNAKVEMLSKERLRLFAGPDGKVLDAEAFNQSYVGGGDSAVDQVKKLGGPVFERTMEYFERESPAVYRNIVELISDVRANELTSLAWQLDRRAGFAQGNALVERSNAVRDHRVHAGGDKGGIRADRAEAARLKREANAIFRNKQNYNIARVADIAVVDTVQTKSYLFGLFESSQTVYAEALPVEIKLYAQDLLNLAVRARKEIGLGVGQESSS